MFILAIAIGIYSYLLMGLGLVGWLYPQAIFLVTLVFFGTSPLWFPSPDSGEGTKRRGIIWWGLFLLIVVQAIVNLVGALGPETGFDALWYHLPIPRIWLEAHRIFFIGGNLYYSAMPKLIDMLYVWGETPAKIMHLVFGLLSTAVTYKIARKWLEQKWAMLAAVIFYSNLVVGWQSITAYIDLGRTFFEGMAFYLLIEKKINKSAVILGLAMATKTIAVGSLGVLGILVWLGTRDFGKLARFMLLAVLAAAPWYVFAWMSTGNPVYPIFSGYKLEWDWTFNLLRLADPINPIYIMVLPVAWMVRKKIPITIAAYCLLSFGVWYLTPRTGGGRFLLPYLPVWSVLAATVIKILRDEDIKKFMVGMVIVIAVISVGYRGMANAKYLRGFHGVSWRETGSVLPVQLGRGRKT